jgi:hypothetical protein
MALQFSQTLLNDRANKITADVGASGYLEIYTGSIPANCAAATTGALLVTLDLANPFAPGASAGVLSPTLPANMNAVATGTAGYWRIFESDNATCVVQGTVGTSGADMILNTLSLVSGGPVQISSWTFTEGGA